MSSGSMKAVVLKGPRDVAVEDRPIPTIQEPTDIIVKVRYTAICGSDLHFYRGHANPAPGFIMGHEFTGDITEVGASVKSLKPGDSIVSPFTLSCGECFYCMRRMSSRCAKSVLLGCPALDGTQAQYIRIPLAEATVLKAPPGVDGPGLCLMADIFPTGYFAMKSALGDVDPKVISESVVVVVGCGPVGLCALAAASDYSPKALLAVDSVPDRLDTAKELGAEPWNFKTQDKELKERVMELTDGRGADYVVEVVGLSPALRLAYDLLRPFGTISSVGVHNAEIPWSGNEGYAKNLIVKMGRCPVRSLFPEALAAFVRKQHSLKFMTENIVPLTDGVKAYDDFDQMRTRKVIFDPWL